MPSMAYAVQCVVASAVVEAAALSGVIVAAAAAPNAAAARSASFSVTHGAAARAFLASGMIAASATPTSAATTTPGSARTVSAAATREAPRTAAAGAVPAFAAAAATTVDSVAAAATAAAGGAALAAAPAPVTCLGPRAAVALATRPELLWRVSLVALPCLECLSPYQSAAPLWCPELLRIPRRPMSRPVPPPSCLILSVTWLVAARQWLQLQWPLPRLLPCGCKRAALQPTQICEFSWVPDHVGV